MRLLFKVSPCIRVTGKMLRVDRKVLGYKMKMNIFLGEGVDWIMSILCI